LNKLFHKRNTCRLCKSLNANLVLKLESVPSVTPNMKSTQSTDKNYDLIPLDLYLCRKCGFLHLFDIVNPTQLYDKYLYETKISIGLIDHFQNLCHDIINLGILNPNSLIIEIGSNDGSFLNLFKNYGYDVLGVDPAKDIVKKANKNNVPSIVGYFSSELAKEIAYSHRKSNLIVANNVIANIDNLDSIFEGINILLEDNGLFVFETQYGLSILNDHLLDVIYHEHLSYFTVKPLVKYLKKFSLEIFNVEKISAKGGSIRFWIKRTNNKLKISNNVNLFIHEEINSGFYNINYYKSFELRIHSIRNRLLSIITECKNLGQKVGIYGTSVGCISLIHQFRLSEYIDFAFDDNPLKNLISGHRKKIRVFNSNKISELNPSLIIILAWRYNKIIIERNFEYTKNGGIFITPLPEIYIH